MAGSKIAATLGSPSMPSATPATAPATDQITKGFHNTAQLYDDDRVLLRSSHLSRVIHTGNTTATAPETSTRDSVVRGQLSTGRASGRLKPTTAMIQVHV